VNIDLVFQIAGIAIITYILQTVVSRAGREELGYMIALAGVVIVSLMVIQLINQLFDAVRAMFHL